MLGRRTNGHFEFTWHWFKVNYYTMFRIVRREFQEPSYHAFKTWQPNPGVVCETSRVTRVTLVLWIGNETLRLTLCFCTPPAWPMSEAPIESRRFVGWWRDAVSDAITSSAYTHHPLASGARRENMDDSFSQASSGGLWDGNSRKICISRSHKPHHVHAKNPST